MLELASARAAMQQIKMADPQKMLVASGITPETFDLVMGTVMWTRDDRINVIRCMDALNHGVCDIVAIPYIDLPAEWIAGSIAAYVHPCNIYTACSWLQAKATVTEMGSSNGKVVQHEAILPSHLFSIVLQLQANNYVDVLSEQFKQEVQKAVDSFIETPA